MIDVAKRTPLDTPNSLDINQHLGSFAIRPISSKHVGKRLKAPEPNASLGVPQWNSTPRADIIIIPGAPGNMAVSMDMQTTRPVPLGENTHRQRRR